MADKEFETEDPLELVGTVMACSDAELEDMGITYIEEYARMGWGRQDVMSVFADPHYRGPHTVYRAKGPKFVEVLMDLVMGIQDAAQRETESDAQSI